MWVPAGLRYWNAKQEAEADIVLVDNMLRTRTEIRRERYGDEWADVVTKLAEEKALIEELGLAGSPDVEPLLEEPAVEEPAVEEPVIEEPVPQPPNKQEPDDGK